MKVVKRDGREEDYDGVKVIRAAEAKSKKTLFTELLEKHMEMAYKAHMVRVGRLMDVKASQNPTMFMEGAIARLGPDEKISKLFFNGYASISIGYVGLYEAVEILYGEPVRKEMAMNILKYMKDICADFKKRSGLAFSLYGTPAAVSYTHLTLPTKLEV